VKEAMLEALPTKGPNLAAGVSLDELGDGIPMEGHFQGEPVLLVRHGEEVLAIGARCSHDGAPLDDGLVVGDTVRCPWHHACFSLRSGEPLAAPAMKPVDGFVVERRANQVFVVGKRCPLPARTPVAAPSSIVIIGTGAAGSAAAETLRREGYAATVTVVGADPDIPYDRPNLSKDYVAGTAPEEWIPLRSREIYREQNIRVEHWAVAQRQDQTAARNMFGAREPFVAVPFFWSAHFDVTVAYVGHAESWDRVAIDGDAKIRDCRVEYWKGDKRLAVATVGRDRASLQAEAEMEMAVHRGETRYA
jgi:nitrite reductase/ring-hydroxylating ferredoxin subunit